MLRSSCVNRTRRYKERSGFSGLPLWPTQRQSSLSPARELAHFETQKWTEAGFIRLPRSIKLYGKMKAILIVASNVSGFFVLDESIKGMALISPHF